MSAIGHEPTDATEAEDGERLMVELGAREITAIPTASFHAGICCCHVARSCEHERHGMFSSRDGIRYRRIAYDHAIGIGSFNVDVIDAHTSTTDHAQLLADLEDLTIDLRCGTHDERIVVFDDVEQFFPRKIELTIDLVSFFFQDLDTCWNDLFCDQDLLRHKNSLHVLPALR